MDWAWSSRVEQADWIAARQPDDDRVCTVPTGFAAYARLLHPIEPVGPGEEHKRHGQTRWAEVARWSGVALEPRTQFWQLGLPERLPLGEVPGRGSPASDVLGEHDGRALARLLREHTTTPERCWFGIWDGYGWDRPAAAPTVPRVQLPHRDYLLYAGAVEAGLAFLQTQREIADLWWPTDRAWCVYGDVDLNATYVGGSTELIEALMASVDLEAVAADPDDPVVTGPGDLPGWLAALVEKAVSELNVCTTSWSWRSCGVSRGERAPTRTTGCRHRRTCISQARSMATCTACVSARSR